MKRAVYEKITSKDVRGRAILLNIACLLGCVRLFVTP